MKKIGLLGGTSWTSTFGYYNFLNQGVHKIYGAFHSAPLFLYSIDYNNIKQNYNMPDGWEKIPALLLAELKTLWQLPIDGFMICNNTLHKAYDILLKQDLIDVKLPIFHALSLTAQKAKAKNYRKILLLGTSYTMQSDFFKNYFYQHNIDVVIPTIQEISTIQAMQTRLSVGQQTPEDFMFFENLLRQYHSQVDAIVLGCTELPLAVPQQHDFCLLNPTQIQCEAALEFITQS